MRLSKIAKFCIFCTIVLWSMSLRSIYTYAHGGDVWSHLLRASNINENGYVGWFVHPLSYFGWYSFSYPAGSHVLISTLINIAGFEPTTSVLFFSFFMAFFSIFSQFILSRLFLNKEKQVFVSVFIYSTMLSVVSMSWNNLSPRLIFIVLYPLTIYLFFKLRTSQNNIFSILILIFILIFTLTSLHRIVLFFGLCILLPILFLRASKTIYPINNFLNKKRNIFLIVISVFIVFLLSQPVSGVQDEGLYSSIVSDKIPLHLWINLAATYGTWYGPFIVFMPFGFLYTINKQFKHTSDNFIILSSLIGLFFIGSQYYLIFFTPFAPILAVIGFNLIKDITSLENKYFITLLILIITLSLIPTFQFFIKNGWFALLLISLVGLYLFLKNHKDLAFKKGMKNKDILYQTLGILIICSVTIFGAIPVKAIEQYHNPYPNDGELVDEARMYGRSYWLNEYSQGPFLANTGGVRNTLSVISGVPYSADYIDISNDYLLLELLEPEFNLTLLWTSGQSVFDTKFDSRYSPKDLEHNIFLGDHNLAKGHKVNFFILSDTLSATCPDSDSCYREEEMVKMLEDDRYVIYTDVKVRIYHYNYEQ